jgi:hypothetical protein
VAFHDPILRDVERFDDYREALRRAVAGDGRGRTRKSGRTARRASTPSREAARLRAEREFNARVAGSRDTTAR